MKKLNKGFTLIELLVVIAIIGVLASVVLASLNTARTKGADVAVKANLSNARAQAELFYDANNGSYMGTINTSTDVCNTAGLVSGVKGIYPSVLAAVQATGNTALVAENAVETTTTGSCNPASGTWVAQAPMKSQNLVSGSSGIDYYCVDSTGQSKLEDAVLAANSTSCL
ncbi:MAG: prepilin-type N-terminal cleavage/methylation domain-containing protein [Candidatus Nomurabacteria bacterium]|nr:prepilin-type N-terminal cleavage/methylation domain-containing protein [Candidatus Nomurabacteria bacterium]